MSSFTIKVGPIPDDDMDIFSDAAYDCGLDYSLVHYHDGIASITIDHEGDHIEEIIYALLYLRRCDYHVKFYGVEIDGTGGS